MMTRKPSGTLEKCVDEVKTSVFLSIAFPIILDGKISLHSQKYLCGCKKTLDSFLGFIIIIRLN